MAPEIIIPLCRALLAERAPTCRSNASRQKQCQQAEESGQGFEPLSDVSHGLSRQRMSDKEEARYGSREQGE